MAVHFSVRDVLFTPSTAGVRIIATTDIPCHLYCRLSSEKPWIHKTPSLRRGVQFAEDVRFCFTVYEDNEQYEAGDTNIHTWWKSDWPVCQTKYFYFWGTIGIEVSVSTTPFFKYHNDGVSPVPTPDTLRTFNSIEPELLRPTGAYPTYIYDCSNVVNPDSESVIIHVRNRYTTDRRFSAWKYDLPILYFGTIRGGDHLWAVIPLDENKCFGAYSNFIGDLDIWAEGYGGRNVKGFTYLTEVTPFEANTWELKTVPDEAVGATAVLVYILYKGAAKHFDLRHPTSFDDYYDQQSVGYACALVGLNEEGKFLIKLELPPDQKAFLLGYINDDIYVYINRRPIPDPPLNAWTARSIKYETSNPNFAVICGAPSGAISTFSLRKHDSMRDIQDGGNFSCYSYIHSDPLYWIDLYRQVDAYHFTLVAEAY